MNGRERQQLDLIAQHELGLAQRTLEERIGAVFAKHSAKRVCRNCSVMVDDRVVM